jgi:uncharacterized protein (DUF2147 family)
MSVRGSVLALALFGLSACGAGSSLPSSPAGRWLTASHNLVVAITPCGAFMCGTVARVLANNSMMSRGASSVAPLPLGARLITGLHADGDHWSGRIFNRENGRTYDCTVRKLSNGELEVRPYIVLAWFGRSQVWAQAR